ncbi:MAG: thrombospondin type 3 repeat-containing protein [Kiritimatiellae bacterium]|nr:thrombospondin type 3 repeat-containing protein [Kiritimatiellia bacterium]
MLEFGSAQFARRQIPASFIAAAADIGSRFHLAAFSACPAEASTFANPGSAEGFAEARAMADKSVRRGIFGGLTILPSLRFLVSAFFILHSTFLFAQGPAWWFIRGAVDTNLPANDYALITQGQLKWMATNACAEMEAWFDAGTNVAALVSGFSNSNNYYLANIGQVKYVVQPFYDRLHALNLTNTFPANMPGYYPWGNAPTTNDYALANIGQVKYVFSFDSAVDTDEDGYSDWQEAALGSNPYDTSSVPIYAISGTLSYAGPQTGMINVVVSTDTGGASVVRSQQLAVPGAFTFTNVPALRQYWIMAWRDTDGDAAKDYWEAQGNAGVNPVNLTTNITNADITMTDPDSDGDGLPDWWELANGLDPFDPDDAEATLINMRETARDRIVYHWQMVFGTTPVFTNTPGSQEDLNDMRDDLNTLSEKNYKIGN